MKLGPNKFDLDFTWFTWHHLLFPCFTSAYMSITHRKVVPLLSYSNLYLFVFPAFPSLRDTD